MSIDWSNDHLNWLQVLPVMANTSKLSDETFVIVRGHSSKAMADQLTAVAKERLGAQLWALTRPDLKAVEHVLTIQLGLPL